MPAPCAGKQLDDSAIGGVTDLLCNTNDSSDLDASSFQAACELLLQRFTETETRDLNMNRYKWRLWANPLLIFHHINWRLELEGDEAIHGAVRAWCRLLHAVGAQGGDPFREELVAYIEARLAHPEVGCLRDYLEMTVATIEIIRPVVSYPSAGEEMFRMMLEDPTCNVCMCQQGRDQLAQLIAEAGIGWD
jgi:hypothetical protein